MSTKTELANRAAIASWIRKRAAAILADTKNELADIMDEGDRSYAIAAGAAALVLIGLTTFVVARVRKGTDK